MLLNWLLVGDSLSEVLIMCVIFFELLCRLVPMCIYCVIETLRVNSSSLRKCMCILSNQDILLIWGFLLGYVVNVLLNFYILRQKLVQGLCSVNQPERYRAGWVLCHVNDFQSSFWTSCEFCRIKFPHCFLGLQKLFVCYDFLSGFLSLLRLKLDDKIIGSKLHASYLHKFRLHKGPLRSCMNPF